ncbi:hypothetical protein SGPA1_50011 [Streptomyces misionensis JCM 4497]
MAHRGGGRVPERGRRPVRSGRQRHPGPRQPRPRGVEAGLPPGACQRHPHRGRGVRPLRRPARLLRPPQAARPRRAGAAQAPGGVRAVPAGGGADRRGRRRHPRGGAGRGHRVVRCRRVREGARPRRRGRGGRCRGRRGCRRGERFLRGHRFRGRGRRGGGRGTGQGGHRGRGRRRGRRRGGLRTGERRPSGEGDREARGAVRAGRGVPPADARPGEAEARAVEDRTAAGGARHPDPDPAPRTHPDSYSHSHAGTSQARTDPHAHPDADPHADPDTHPDPAAGPRRLPARRAALRRGRRRHRARDRARREQLGVAALRPVGRRQAVRARGDRPRRLLGDRRPQPAVHRLRRARRGGRHDARPRQGLLRRLRRRGPAVAVRDGQGPRPGRARPCGPHRADDRTARRTAAQQRLRPDLAGRLGGIPVHLRVAAVCTRRMSASTSATP